MKLNNLSEENHVHTNTHTHTHHSWSLDQRVDWEYPRPPSLYVFSVVCVCSCNVVSCAGSYWCWQGPASPAFFLSGRPFEPPCVSAAISGLSLPFMCGGPHRFSPIYPLCNRLHTHETHTQWCAITMASNRLSAWEPEPILRHSTACWSAFTQE